MKTLFCCSAMDRAWVRETHLKGHSLPGFRSFVLHGNEDCPSKIELFLRKLARVTDKPVETFVRSEETGEMVVQKNT